MARIAAPGIVDPSRVEMNVDVDSIRHRSLPRPSNQELFTTNRRFQKRAG